MKFFVKWRPLFHIFYVVAIVGLEIGSCEAKANSDTTLVYLDFKSRQVDPHQGDAYSYILKVWKQQNLWGGELYAFPEMTKLYSCFYTDSTRQKLQGQYTSYFASGKVSEQGVYEKGQRQGLFEGWHENGKRRSQFYYNKGLLSDTCRRWNDKGELTYQSVTNSDGTGQANALSLGGGFKETGPLLKGAKNGEWTITKEEKMVMKLQFINDSIAGMTCYDSLGSIAGGDCIYERPASFPGGPAGWRNYLQRNLRYPAAAKDSYIEGTVKIKFVVDKQGVLSDYTVVASPHELLSKEVIRLLQNGPQWLPAIQYNRPVKMGHIQNVTFRLQ